MRRADGATTAGDIASELDWEYRYPRVLYQAAWMWDPQDHHEDPVTWIEGFPNGTVQKIILFRFHEDTRPVHARIDTQGWKATYANPRYPVWTREVGQCNWLEHIPVLDWVRKVSFSSEVWVRDQNGCAMKIINTSPQVSSPQSHRRLGRFCQWKRSSD